MGRTHHQIVPPPRFLTRDPVYYTCTIVHEENEEYLQCSRKLVNFFSARKSCQNKEKVVLFVKWTEKDRYDRIAKHKHYGILKSFNYEKGRKRVTVSRSFDRKTRKASVKVVNLVLDKLLTQKYFRILPTF